MLATTIRDVLLTTPGVQSVGTVDLLSTVNGATVVAARVGFGPATPVSDVVMIMSAARTNLRATAPELVDVVLEPEVAAPRGDANPPTDIFVIRGAD
ncbi:MAG: hypothetical protein KIT89_11175 [Microcella sp.]|uniref:hypothetical protein n=1 Tax=Microcella sp. TaxID=1913979 RepID=UPI0024C8622C|nr:hypothetical protein [Microcella sp.]UYN83248.1 MAG: hypothetical protein KIT89_11175 [Microcella sp.]